MDRLIGERMRMDLKFRFYAEPTQRTYVEHVKRYMAFSKSSPEELGGAEVRRYLSHLMGLNVSRSYFAQASAALRFSYCETLGRPRMRHLIPAPRRRDRRLPVVLSPDEIVGLLNAVRNLKHLALLMTGYSAGLRLSELTRLRVADIDSGRMIISVRLGKGSRDRMVMLASALLPVLRQYWRAYRPNVWLFPGRTRGRPITNRWAQQLCSDAGRRAGIRKRVTMNALRHSFATHLFEAGADVLRIQRLLGHASPLTTLIYAHVSTAEVLKVPSPLDLLSRRGRPIPSAGSDGA